MSTPFSKKSSRKNDVRFDVRDGELCIELSGTWDIGGGLWDSGEIEDVIHGSSQIQRMVFDVNALKDWDTSLLSFLVKCRQLCNGNKINFVDENLPENVKKLLQLSQVVFEDREVVLEKRKGFVESVGEGVIAFVKGSVDVLAFLGKGMISISRIFSGNGQMRIRDFWMAVQEVGAEALPIVTLISFLVGFILAFVGFTQLNRFGATIYVADLVGIAMVREMGAMMSGVIMCGRTGGAFAAILGSMKIQEEIDALKITGISPYDFLVSPRILALGVMMPLLCIYADFIGVVAGLIVTTTISDVSFTEYVNETRKAITMTHIMVGLYKSVVFGILIAVAGCLRGMQCTSSASGVGDAATSAVVTGITSIIVADALFAVLFNALKM